MKASIINSILYYGMVRGIAEVGGGVPTRWSETSTIVGNIIELWGQLGRYSGGSCRQSRDAGQKGTAKIVRAYGMTHM